MNRFETLNLTEIRQSLLDHGYVERLLSSALEEDLGDVGDVTSLAMIPPDRTATAALVARTAGVIAGPALLPGFRHPLISEIVSSFRSHVDDGSECVAGQTIAELSGRLRSMLAAERTLLNLLCHLSGVATLTSRFVNAVAGTSSRICDTRKTTPGLRLLEKYAVRCGGGVTHRLGLFDAMLIKDNHLAGVELADLSNVVTDAASKARASHALAFVEVEVDSIAQFEQILRIERGLVDMVLLDNMTIDQLRAAVELRNARQRMMLLEASGGVTLETVRAIAETGVDRISVGAITHSAPVLDIGLDIR